MEESFREVVGWADSAPGSSVSTGAAFTKAVRKSLRAHKNHPFSDKRLQHWMALHAEFATHWDGLWQARKSQYNPDKKVMT